MKKKLNIPGFRLLLAVITCNRLLWLLLSAICSYWLLPAMDCCGFYYL